MSAGRRDSAWQVAPTGAGRPGLWDLFFTFVLLSLQSFGGGASTFMLINRTCLQRGWLDDQEFVRTWALAQVTPGINLLKLTILIGSRLRGWGGVAACVSGLMIPTALITALMTAGFALIRANPLVQAVMKGVMPATIGLSLAMALQMALPLFARARREGPARVSVSAGVLAAAAALMALGWISPVLVLLLSGGLTAALLALVPARPQPAPREQGGGQ